MAPLPPREQRHRFLRYEGLEYSDSDIADFDSRLERIHMREVHRVPVFDFGGLPDLMFEGLTARLTMKHRDGAGVSIFSSQAWRRMLDIRGPLVHELILEFFSMFRFGQALLDLDTPGVLQFQLSRARRRMSWREFIVALGLHTKGEMQTPGFGVYWVGSARQAPEKLTVTDLFYLRGMDVGSVNVPYLLAKYLRFVARSVCCEAWVAPGPERQPDAVAGAPAEVDDVLVVDEGGQADLAPVQAPQQPPPPPPAPSRTMVQRFRRLEEDVQVLHQDVGSLQGLMERSVTNQGRLSMWMVTCMTQLMKASGLTYQAFDESFRGSSPATFERRTRQRTG
ncbi:hypothetical protein Tco_1390939, partial [Tanacetum coccineum]